jgi:alpha-tubulin suppressor-like RCC1 family protein
VISDITNAVTVVAGGFLLNEYTCALLSGGSVLCWGANGYGQLGIGNTESRSAPVTISGMRTENRSAPVPISGMRDAVAVVAGESHTCALLSSGSVQCWGSNTYGEIGNGSTANSSMPVTVSGF